MVVILIERLPNETPQEYHRRIVYGKLVDKTLADYDYSEIAEAAYGQEYSSDSARKMLYGSRKTLELLENESLSDVKKDCPEETISEIDARMIELRKERQKFYDYRNAFNKAVREQSREEELYEILENSIKEGNLPSLNYTPREEVVSGICSNNDLLVSLNDIHYGANHSSYWGSYNSDICKEMMNKYLDRIISIAKTHTSENCYVFCAGDCISGSIHKTLQITNKENLIEQIKGVSELMSEFLAALSPYFNRVVFFSVSGNHSRLDKKDEALISERLDDLVGWYMKARLQNFENIVVEGGDRIDPTMCLINIRGKNYCGIHGDFDTTPGKIQTLQTMCRVPLYAVLSGHLHHNAVDSVQGIKTIMAGSFLGMDDFCIQKRIVGTPEQMVCVCDTDGVRCHYDIKF